MNYIQNLELEKCCDIVHITCTFTVQLKKCTVSAFMTKLFVHVFRNLAKYGQSPVPVTSIGIQQNTLYSM